MNARFPKAVMESIRNRELLAQALVEQEQELVRKRRIIRLLCIGAPLAGIFYVMHGPPLMEMEGLKSLSNIQKSIFKQAAAQAQAGGKMLIGEEKKAKEVMANAATPAANDAYTKNESVDDMLQELEARNAKLQDFSSKHKSSFSQEQLMAMVEKANQNQQGPNAASEMENLASNLQDRNTALGAALQEEGPQRAPAMAAQEEVAPAAPAYDSLPSEKLSAVLPEVQITRKPASMAYQPTTESELIRIALLAPSPVKSPGFHEYVPVNKIDF